MFKTAEIEAALRGAWGLACRDETAISHFPNSEPAFWRSFAAIAFVAPVNLLSTFLRAGGEVSGSYLFANALTVLVQWIAFPLMMIVVVRLLGLSASYGLFVIAYNWSSVLVVSVLLPSAVFSAVISDATGLTNMVTMISILFILWFTTFLTRAALATNWVNAIGIIVFDILTSLLISGLIFRSMGLV